VRGLLQFEMPRGIVARDNGRVAAGIWPQALRIQPNYHLTHANANKPADQ